MTATTPVKSPTADAHRSHSVRIWDLPTRLFHWLLVSLVIGLVISGNLGGNAMPVHGLLGQGVLTLVLFRLIWGLVGGHWSRFTTFVPTPRRLLAYWVAMRQSGHAPSAGHNPLGALSVLAILTVLLLQVASGLISDDEIAFSGPWAVLAPGDWVSFATGYHKTWGKALLLSLVALHLLAIVWHRLRLRHNLLPAMWHGEQQVPVGTVASRDALGTRVLALLILIACAWLVRWLMAWGQ